MNLPIGSIDPYSDRQRRVGPSDPAVFARGLGKAVTAEAGAWKPWEEHFAVIHGNQRGANFEFGSE